MEFFKLNLGKKEEGKKLKKPVPVKFKVIYQVLFTVIVISASIFVISLQRKEIENVAQSVKESKQKTYVLNDLIEYVSYLETENKKAIKELIPYVDKLASTDDLTCIQKEIIDMANKYRLDPLFDYSGDKKESPEDLSARNFNLLLTGSMRNINLFLNELKSSDILFFLKDMVAVKNTNEELPDDLKESSVKVETMINMTEEEQEKQKEKLTNVNNYQVSIIGYVYLRKASTSQTGEQSVGQPGVEGGYQEEGVIKEQ